MDVLNGVPQVCGAVQRVPRRRITGFLKTFWGGRGRVSDFHFQESPVSLEFLAVLIPQAQDAFRHFGQCLSGIRREDTIAAESNKSPLRIGCKWTSARTETLDVSSSSPFYPRCRP